MAPRNPPNAVDPNAELNTTYSLALLAEYTHTLDSLPLDLSRNFADLRELDAVLSSSMNSITHKIHHLTGMIERGLSSKEERLRLLAEIAEEAGRLKLGGEDKIRVAAQAADNLNYNAGHLRMLAENLPGFDASSLNRRTVYPHIAVRSYMPAISLETGRRRRGGYGSLLVSAPDPSPAKRKRAHREDDLDGMRSPRKDKTQETNARSRARSKKYAILSFILLPTYPSFMSELTALRHPPNPSYPSHPTMFLNHSRQIYLHHDPPPPIPTLASMDLPPDPQPGARGPPHKTTAPTRQTTDTIPHTSRMAMSTPTPTVTLAQRRPPHVEKHTTMSHPPHYIPRYHILMSTAMVHPWVTLHITRVHMICT